MMYLAKVYCADGRHGENVTTGSQSRSSRRSLVAGSATSVFSAAVAFVRSSSTLPVTTAQKLISSGIPKNSNPKNVNQICPSRFTCTPYNELGSEGCPPSGD